VFAQPQDAHHLVVQHGGLLGLQLEPAGDVARGAVQQPAAVDGQRHAGDLDVDQLPSARR
jgi:hypothetical protein